MRIHSGNTERFIQTLAASITKDPRSLENWRCLHIKNPEEVSFEWVDTVLKQLKMLHIGYDCDIVHCIDNDVLIISRNLYDAQLCEIADELDILNAASVEFAIQSDFVLYDVYRDWQLVHALLLAKAAGVALALANPSSHSFSEVSSLQAVFEEAKELRKTRMPPNVMIVEDDPLTRRLVANAFKEKYALITAETAQEAVTNYLLYAPDVVFLDIGLPDASGFDVLRQILQCDPNAYVVMFSGNSYLDNVTNALSNGGCRIYS